MEPATILVLVLSAGVVALLVWFEINSRRNERNKQRQASLAQSHRQASSQPGDGKTESATEKPKAA